MKNCIVLKFIKYIFVEIYIIFKDKLWLYFVMIMFDMWDVLLSFIGIIKYFYSEVWY